MYLKDTEQIYLSGSDLCGFFEAFAAERPDEKVKISKGLTLRLKWLGNPGGTGQKKPEEKAGDRGVGQEKHSLQSVFLQVRLQETGIVEVSKKSTMHISNLALQWNFHHLEMIFLLNMKTFVWLGIPGHFM